MKLEKHVCFDVTLVTAMLAGGRNAMCDVCVYLCIKSLKHF